MCIYVCVLKKKKRFISSELYFSVEITFLGFKKKQEAGKKKGVLNHRKRHIHGGQVTSAQLCVFLNPFLFLFFLSCVCVCVYGDA